MKLLFITRKYPPSVGGMEKVSYALSKELAKQVPTKVIAWGGSQKWLPYFLPKAFLQALYLIPSQRYTNIHLGDALLAPLGLMLKMFTGCKVSVTVHGLDITYKNPLYQIVVPFCIKRLDRIVCISSATQTECIKRGIPAAKITIIPWGVYPDEFKIDATRQDLEKIAGTDLEGKKVLITVGRLVKRKGVAWFIEKVIPKLGSEYVYLVAGDGPERQNIAQLIGSLKMQDRIKLLGRISDHDLKVLYNTADVFVMPNIAIKGDIEGFGIVAIEAASVGTIVVGSAVEGVNEAVKSDMGVLLENYLPGTWLKSISQALTVSRNGVIEATLKNYSWVNTSDMYMSCVLE